ncbi:phosphoenolpyruvate-protein phosphotransferase [Thiopseudomonas alkaliphila]|uniref:phosphoenolpyruvate--protein phosphotransferase n=1 Tax=Thiopseudomonas alkaliphila TaxID=1697053 RepID=UPI00069F61DA|nr:phosphoenolpyruvate--protein phosphotransferase [Thiopseudomonas alkaliphila]AKX45864.1 phosphoenolpyruvate-protein phosphotransferase [Thiopseudomonas alkaliphila]
MLRTLSHISQAVNGAKDLPASLAIIVSQVRQAMRSHVCSVYLKDPHSHRYVLMATEGLNKRSIGKVSMAANEGLVGLVGSRAETISLEDATSHPRFRYFAETGEERYSSFLGTPIIHHRKVLGVLVVQQKERRQFDEADEAFLVTMSAQLSGVIAHAEATGSIRGLNKRGKGVQVARFRGVPGAPGAAIGKAVVVLPIANLDVVPDKPSHNIEAQLKLFNRALDAVREDIKVLAKRLNSQLRPQEQALFDVYLMMLDQGALPSDVVRVIQSGQWAQGALRQVVQQHVQRFEKMEDAYLKERAQDIKDLGNRLLAYLQEVEHEPINYPENTILISEELSPAMLGEVPAGKLAGLISVQGSRNSHVAILARAMGIPTVVAAGDLPYSRLNGIEIIIDGYHGDIFTNPTRLLREQYTEMIAEEQQLDQELDNLRHLPCATLDNVRIPLWANTGLIADVQRAQNRGAEGVGLYRSEVAFMGATRFPSESEQIALYREHLQAFAPQPVTMRTLDIGGDKPLSYFPIKEKNPYLGWRGIRVTLDHPEIFLVQLRSMMEASVGLNNLRILLPMISGIAELKEAIHFVHRAWVELRNEGLDVKRPAIGVMIEVPAAVYQAYDIAQLVDFLSVGSNDLTQYLLAVDRNNARVASLYDYFHPAVLTALQHVVEAAHRLGKPVSICGEMAGDPVAAVLLLAMGFDNLSMNATQLPKVKSLLRQITACQAKQLLNEAMQLDEGAAIHHLLKSALKNMGINPRLNIALT